MVHVKARVALQPTLDRGALVGAVVVTDQVHVEVLGNLAVDLLEELLELDGAVAAMLNCPYPARATVRVRVEGRTGV